MDKRDAITEDGPVPHYQNGGACEDTDVSMQSSGGWVEVDATIRGRRCIPDPVCSSCQKNGGVKLSWAKADIEMDGNE